MTAVESFGLHAASWAFLKKPDAYVKASERRALEKDAENGKRDSYEPLLDASTRRQMQTARDILTRLSGAGRTEAVRGILLADDVGLGKTTVAALVAWVVARAGKPGTQKRVRILAPNDVMARRWTAELHSHVHLLGTCAPSLDASHKNVTGGKLSKGCIQVVKHSHVTQGAELACDLLIVDEAHRAKGATSKFSTQLKKQAKQAKRVLILTATPFSIDIKELHRMLDLVGGSAAKAPVSNFSKALDRLYSSGPADDMEALIQELTRGVKEAVEGIRRFVIRHGVDDLPKEVQYIGKRGEWVLEVPHATPDELELMLRMDRLLRKLNDAKAPNEGSTNDPRFHVGWQYYRKRLKHVEDYLKDKKPTDGAVLRHHVNAIKPLLKGITSHSKIKAVGSAIQKKISEGEKVLVFCHHHATAQELTLHLGDILSVGGAAPAASAGAPGLAAWRAAWNGVLDHYSDANSEMRDAFINWLASDQNRAKVWGWLGQIGTKDLEAALKSCKPMQFVNGDSILNVANKLFNALMKSPSTRAILRQASNGTKSPTSQLPGSRPVLGVCEPLEKFSDLFVMNSQPDAAIMIFNSPFGPDVLVVTDKLSEGVDLHRYCRHLIHYELDPSPIRTVQRNGRVRRVNSWAAATGEEILYAYPAFKGTRDEKLVSIMKRRLSSFSLLLGGARDFDVDSVADESEDWREKVLAAATQKLAKEGGRLKAR